MMDVDSLSLSLETKPIAVRHHSGYRVVRYLWSLIPITVLL